MNFHFHGWFHPESSTCLDVVPPAGRSAGGGLAPSGSGGVAPGAVRGLLHFWAFWMGYVDKF